MAQHPVVSECTIAHESMTRNQVDCYACSTVYRAIRNSVPARLAVGKNVGDVKKKIEGLILKLRKVGIWNEA